MTDSLKDTREWLFRGLMFEAEAENFRKAGLRIGADLKDVEASLLEQTLSPFGVSSRNEALQMARIYALLYCFENSIRDLIKERLLEKDGSDWWTKGVPEKIRKYAEDRQKSAKDESWLEGQKNDPLGFVDFGHLTSIVIERWSEFSDLIPSQHWMKQKLEEIEKARNFIAHNRLLSASEFQRLELYIADWNKQVGL